MFNTKKRVMNKSAVLWYLWVQSADVSGRRCKVSIRPERKPGKTQKNKNFVVPALKALQVGGVFSLRGYQENPNFVKYLNGGK